jgi:two-component system NtrC family sensor kinase
MLRARIGTRVIVGVAVVTAATIGGLAVLILRAHRAELVAELTRGANQLSETIKSSTHDDMLENRRDRLHRQIETIGRQEGIERVRIFNKDGRIMFSSDPREIGTALDKNAEACYACHAVGAPLERLPIQARARIYERPDRARVLGIINPIQNEPACSSASCHAHPARATVLGVLDVNVSLAEVDRDIAASQLRMMWLALATVVASSLLLGWLNRRLVIRPVRALVAATRRVASGDLATRIPAQASHELGDLARAFDTMTERVAEAQRQLTQADKLASIGRLAAGVAHEINNPLTGVLTYASHLARRAERDPETRQDLEVVVREAKRCRDIVKELLDFARPAPPERRPTELNEVVRRSVSVVMSQLALNRVALELDLAESLPALPADANQLQQVVINLLLNAADAIGAGGGAIRVATRQATVPQPSVEISVEDDGCGIRAEDMTRLFEPFFTTKIRRGTGLGLAVTWGIVKAHGGTIDVRSEQDKGTRFTVRLPLLPAHGGGAAPDRAAPPAEAFRESRPLAAAWRERP